MKSEPALPPLREVIAALGLSARKSLGQNFILDLNLTRRIAAAAGPLDGSTVIEIGPGPGGLTRSLLAEGALRVIAIERDRRCIEALEQIAEAYSGRLEVHEADALKFDYAKLGAGPCRIVANLPYGIATQLLLGWIRLDAWPPWWDRMVLMFQREVAERIVAKPGSKAYGRLSILAQWRTQPRILFNLPPSAFVPAPKVSSALVEFTPIAAPQPDCSLQVLEAITGAAFGQRRKMLKTSLKQICLDPLPVLQQAGIEPTARPETLSVGQFGSPRHAARRHADAINRAAAHERTARDRVGAPASGVRRPKSPEQRQRFSRYRD